MKTFKDLKFEIHEVGVQLKKYSEAKHAVMEFPNNFGVSVLLGDCFYSNGIDTYELAVLYKGKVAYFTDITRDVLTYLTESQVSEAMEMVQKL